MICAAQQPAQITEELLHGREVRLFYLLTKSRLANKKEGKVRLMKERPTTTAMERATATDVHFSMHNMKMFKVWKFI